MSHLHVCLEVYRLKDVTSECRKTLKQTLQHNAGSTKSTKGYRPWVLVYKEEFKTLQEARNREIFLKSGIGRAFLDRLHL